MWSVGKRGAKAEVVVYLGATEWRVVHGDRVIAAETVAGLEDALARWEAILPSLPRAAACQVLLSGAFCQPFLLPPVEGATSSADWLAVAQASVATSTSLIGDAAIWLDDSRQSPRLAVAMDAEIKRRLESGIGRRRLSLRPWWSEALSATLGDARRGPLDGLALVDSDVLTLMLGDDATYRVAETRLLEGASPRALLNRMLISLGRDGELPMVAMSPLSEAAREGAMPFLSEALA